MSSDFQLFLLNNNLGLIFASLQVQCLLLCPYLRILLLYLVFNNFNLLCFDVVYLVFILASSLQRFLNLWVDVFFHFGKNLILYFFTLLLPHSLFFSTSGTAIIRIFTCLLYSFMCLLHFNCVLNYKYFLLNYLPNLLFFYFRINKMTKRFLTSNLL